jgi:hypothetical protein
VEPGDPVGTLGQSPPGQRLAGIFLHHHIVMPIGPVTRAGLGLTPAPARQREMAAAEEAVAGTLTTRLDTEGAGEIAAGYCACSAELRDPGSNRQCAAGTLAMRALRRALLRAQA